MSVRLIVSTGGGYNLGYARQAFPQFFDLYKKLETASLPISIISLEYSLAPAAKYPAQLKEASAAYSHLINALNISPNNIIVGGDSAGANLALQLIRHISKPHPKVNPINSSNHKTLQPSKCVLVSPWAAPGHNCPSVAKYQDVDILVKRVGDRWAGNWKGSHVDEFTDPVVVSPLEWKEYLIPTLVISGDKEMLFDDIKRLCDNMKEVFELLVDG